VTGDGSTLTEMACSTVSFDESIGSDHATLIAEIPLYWDAPPPPPNAGWKVDIAMVDMWKTRFCKGGHALLAEPVTIPEFNEVAVTLTRGIETTCSRLFRRTGGPTTGKGLPWWNDACRLAIA
jgi:hypothetical protein